MVVWWKAGSLMLASSETGKSYAVCDSTGSSQMSFSSSSLISPDLISDQIIQNLKFIQTIATNGVSGA